MATEQTGFAESGAYGQEGYGGRRQEVLGKAKEKIKSRVADQKEKAAEGLHDVADALRQTAENVPAERQQVSRFAETAARKVEEFSEFLRGKDMDQLVADAERFIRQKPAVFLGGSLAAGFLLARMLRSGASGRQMSESEGLYGGTMGKHIQSGPIPTAEEAYSSESP
jgi:ElaB/YqjD/DUF883 family membrane-anchored ribosome-binding protein